MDEKLITLSDVVEHFLKVGSIDGGLTNDEMSLLTKFRDAEQKCRTDAVSAMTSIRLCLEAAVKDIAQKNGLHLKREDQSSKDLYEIECELVDKNSDAIWLKMERSFFAQCG